MKHLILDNDNVILAVGDTYAQQPDCVPNRYVHNVDGLLFDQNFVHVEVENADGAAVGLTKCENGQVVPYVSAQNALKQEGYDNAVLELLNMEV